MARFRQHKYRKLQSTFYSGLTEGAHEHGVGIILADKVAKSVKNFIPISSKILLVKLLATLVDVNIIQVYGPTAQTNRRMR